MKIYDNLVEKFILKLSPNFCIQSLALLLLSVFSFNIEGV